MKASVFEISLTHIGYCTEYEEALIGHAIRQILHANPITLPNPVGGITTVTFPAPVHPDRRKTAVLRRGRYAQARWFFQDNRRATIGRRSTDPKRAERRQVGDRRSKLTKVYSMSTDYRVRALERRGEADKDRRKS